MASINIGLSGTISDVSSTAVARKWSDSFGGSGLQLPTGRITFGSGTGVGNVNQIYVASFSIATTVTQEFDMKTGLTNVLGDAFSLSLLKLVIVILDTATTGEVWLGPQNLTNGCQAWFSVATANGRETVKDKVVHVDQNGWVVGASTKILGLYNSTAGTVTGTIILAGES